MRGRRVWISGGLMIACVGSPPPAPVAAATAPTLPAFSEVRPLRNETTEKTCSLPHEIVIAARNNELLVNGATLELLPLPPIGTLPFVDLLLPCRGEHHFIFEFAPETPATQVAGGKTPCAGLSLSLGPEAKAAFLETALRAMGSKGALVPVLDLRQPQWDNDSNALSSSGRLPPEVTQSVVRKSYGNFRNCYEQGLARNPKLEGRVSARFDIERDGSVQRSANDGSELPDAEAVKCVVAQFLKLKFPPPDGGIVTVVYPIMLSAG